MNKENLDELKENLINLLISKPAILIIISLIIFLISTILLNFAGWILFGFGILITMAAFFIFIIEL